MDILNDDKKEFMDEGNYNNDTVNFCVRESHSEVSVD